MDIFLGRGGNAEVWGNGTTAKKVGTFDEIEIVRNYLIPFPMSRIPNVVQFLSVQGNNIHMERLFGGDLFDRIAQRTNFTEQIAAQWIRSILKGLDFLHSQLSIIHRYLHELSLISFLTFDFSDIKPENIMFESPLDTSELKIIDFGHAMTFQPEVGYVQSISRSQWGTLGYRAPESILEGRYGPESDVWSLGVTFYCLLVGFPPFDLSNRIASNQAVLAGRYFPMSHQAWNLISDSAKNLVSRMLTVDLAQRITIPEILSHPWIVQHTTPTPSSFPSLSSSSTGPLTMEEERSQGSLNLVGTAEALARYRSHQIRIKFQRRVKGILFVHRLRQLAIRRTLEINNSDENGEEEGNYSVHDNYPVQKMISVPSLYPPIFELSESNDNNHEMITRSSSFPLEPEEKNKTEEEEEEEEENEKEREEKEEGKSEGERDEGEGTLISMEEYLRLKETDNIDIFLSSPITSIKNDLHNNNNNNNSNCYMNNNNNESSSSSSSSSSSLSCYSQNSNSNSNSKQQIQLDLIKLRLEEEGVIISKRDFQLSSHLYSFLFSLTIQHLNNLKTKFREAIKKNNNNTSPNVTLNCNSSFLLTTSPRSSLSSHLPIDLLLPSPPPPTTTTTTTTPTTTTTTTPSPPLLFDVVSSPLDSTTTPLPSHPTPTTPSISTPPQVGVTFPQFCEVVRSSGLGVLANPAIFQVFDRDGNGEVDYREFLSTLSLISSSPSNAATSSSSSSSKDVSSTPPPSSASVLPPPPPPPSSTSSCSSFLAPISIEVSDHLSVPLSNHPLSDHPLPSLLSSQDQDEKRDDEERELARFYFDLIDIDNSGSLSIEEVSNVMGLIFSKDTELNPSSSSFSSSSSSPISSRSPTSRTRTASNNNSFEKYENENETESESLLPDMPSVDQFFLELDINGDGYVSFEEFYQWSRANLILLKKMFKN